MIWPSIAKWDAATVSRLAPENMTPEEKARERIDAMLIASGWVVQDYRQFDPSAGRGIALREAPLKSGTCDYLLLVDRKALGVLEAKKEGTLLSGVAEQSAHYAESLPDFIQAIAPGTLPFLYESTGVETFFRDERDPEPRSRRVFSFHRPETLAAFVAEPATLRARLATMTAADRPDDIDPIRSLATLVNAVTRLASTARRASADLDKIGHVEVDPVKDLQEYLHRDRSLDKDDDAT